MQTRQIDLESHPFEVSIKNGDMYLRMYGITDDVVTRHKWLVKNSQIYRESFKGQPVIDYDKTPGPHNPQKLFTNLQKWRAASAAVAVGVVEGLDWNDAKQTHDVIWKVTDPDTRAIIQDCLDNKKPLPWSFSSPAIWGLKMRTDPSSGIKIYDEWTGVNMAIMRVNPAYPRDIAQINENICIGGMKCAQELAAVAAGPPSEDDAKTKNFTFDNTDQAKNKAGIDKMDPQDKGKEPVPYEVYIGLQNSKDQEIKDLKNKLEAAVQAQTDAGDKIKTVTEERDTLKTKVDDREKKDRETYFTERFNKIFTDENEVKIKVNHFIEKNLSEDDFNKLYGSMYDAALEAEKTEAKKEKSQLDKAGVASGDNGQMDEKLDANIETALNLSLHRRRLW